MPSKELSILLNFKSNVVKIMGDVRASLGGLQESLAKGSASAADFNKIAARPEGPRGGENARETMSAFAAEAARNAAAATFKPRPDCPHRQDNQRGKKEAPDGHAGNQ
jgi:hypothetical protein